MRSLMTADLLNAFVRHFGRVGQQQGGVVCRPSATMYSSRPAICRKQIVIAWSEPAWLCCVTKHFAFVCILGCGV